MTHQSAQQRAHLSLEGLSIGDAFGQQYFLNGPRRPHLIQNRELPPPIWYVTDDTLMSVSIVRILTHYNCIDQDALALDFAQTYTHHSDRGYGGTAHRILRHIQDGVAWSTASSEVFDGMGSMGNGGAMRAAPVGAYFKDDPMRASREAMLSAQVTHAHPDAQHGAMAIALAAAFICAGCEASHLIATVVDHLPNGPIKNLMHKADSLPRHYSLATAASVLGNGVKLLASDTVPIVLWCLTRASYAWDDVLWSLFECGGDVDTTCAMAGGLLALCDGVTIPEHWLESRESLAMWMDS